LQPEIGTNRARSKTGDAIARVWKFAIGRKYCLGTRTSASI